MLILHFYVSLENDIEEAEMSYFFYNKSFPNLTLSIMKITLKDLTFKVYITNMYTHNCTQRRESELTAK